MALCGGEGNPQAATNTTPQATLTVTPVKVPKVTVKRDIKKPIPQPKYRCIECPLSEELQREIFTICESCNVSFELVMAMIKQESNFTTDAVGDSGRSVGLMQIQERWHYETMKELGVTNLYDPIENVKVGVAILQKSFLKNSEVYYVLMEYNGGTKYANNMTRAGKVSDYAKEITERAREYEKTNGI